LLGQRVVERFFRSLKSEWIGEQQYENHEQAKAASGSSWKSTHNFQRIHSTANKPPPVLYQASLL
jgi:putative transposase